MITIRRGSTPNIICHIPDSIDMSEITNVWLYLTQQVHGKDVVIVDKLYSDMDIDPIESIISVKLSQEETLALKLGTATIQIRLLMKNGDCLPSSEESVRVLQVYKDGVMEDEQQGD